MHHTAATAAPQAPWGNVVVAELHMQGACELGIGDFDRPTVTKRKGICRFERLWASLGSLVSATLVSKTD